MNTMDEKIIIFSKTIETILLNILDPMPIELGVLGKKSL